MDHAKNGNGKPAVYPLVVREEAPQADAEMLAHLPRPLMGLMDDAFKFARREMTAVEFLFACKAFVMNVRDAQVACEECDGLSRTWKEYNCPACGNRGWKWRE